MVFPELSVMLDPRRRIFHRLSDKPAAVHAPVFVPLYQSRSFQHAQMFRNSRQGHLVRRRKLAHRSFALRQSRKNPAASRIR